MAQPGRAQRSGRWGRAFKSRRPDQNYLNNSNLLNLFFPDFAYYTSPFFRFLCHPRNASQPTPSIRWKSGTYYNFLRHKNLGTTCNYFSKSFTPLSWSGFSAASSPTWKAYLTATGYDICNSIVLGTWQDTGKMYVINHTPFFYRFSPSINATIYYFFVISLTC